MKKEKYNAKKKEAQEKLLIYSASVVIPMGLTTIGVTAIALGNLPLTSCIVIGGLSIGVGIQGVTSGFNYFNDIIKTRKKIKHYKEKDKIEEYKNKNIKKEKQKKNYLNTSKKSTLNNSFTSTKYVEEKDKVKVLIKRK